MIFLQETHFKTKCFFAKSLLNCRSVETNLMKVLQMTLPVKHSERLQPALQVAPGEIDDIFDT